MDNTDEQRIISFCTGGRMLDMGLERVIPNLRTVAAVEVEAFAAFNLAAAVEKGVVAPFPVWSDIKTFPSSAFYGKIHGITGGYPCQPFSAAGKRQGKADPRHLWPHFERHIGAIRPLWGFFENVEGHLSLGFDEVQDSLHRLGYKVEGGIYSAAEMGATQVRERLFILAATDIRELWHSVADHQSQRNRPIPELVGWGASAELEQGREAVADRHSCGLRLQQNAKQQQPPLFVGANDETSGNANEQNGERPILAGGIDTQGREKQVRQSTNAGQTLADTTSQRSGQRQQGRPPRFFNQNGIKWPAPPGAPQHEWEVARVAKSGLGCTVDGYNFRADILRMLGNGVVEPVAAHAFYDLLLKQAKNFKLI